MDILRRPKIYLYIKVWHIAQKRQKHIAPQAKNFCTILRSKIWIFFVYQAQNKTSIIYFHIDISRRPKIFIYFRDVACRGGGGVYAKN